MPMPSAKACAAPDSVTGAIIHDHLSCIRLIHALQNAHERGFAGAIAADNGVDGSADGGKIHAVIGGEGAKAARDTARAQAHAGRVLMRVQRGHGIESGFTSGNPGSPGRRRSRP